ncbi:CFEM domain-containing protein [Colletotrichum plurivorum]|uniref:CFEM domain-containing protein n=1 Tax=Colletotrichum plurivorum TaxID=2175906 RepID=A0A8H6KQI7_9PEZI|nr:CFEM domain-containing protein [Colletotrichum plurivorum]
MKYTIVLAALTACVAAQDPSIIPECARDCLLKATASATTCKDGDYSCTCKPENKVAIQSAATGCVIAACGVDKALNEVVPASDKLCSAAAAGPATTAAATSAAVSSAAASAASSAASAASSLASAASSAASAASSAASAASSAASAATTAKPSASATKPAGNGTAPAPTTSAVQAGAAGLAPIGGLAMLALGALAL